MSVIDLLLNTLAEFNYPIFRQGEIGADEAYPDSFFTYWNFDTPDSSHYDNKPTISDWGFWVNFFTNDAEKLFTITEQTKKKLEEAGFILTGKGEDAQSDEVTHSGRRLTAYYKEKY